MSARACIYISIERERAYNQAVPNNEVLLNLNTGDTHGHE